LLPVADAGSTRQPDGWCCYLSPVFRLERVASKYWVASCLAKAASGLAQSPIR
jgi:hypothetical protein